LSIRQRNEPRPSSCDTPRSNRRIQVFDGDGTFLREFTIDAPVPPDAKPTIGNMPDEAAFAAGTFAPGAPWAICFSPPPNQVLYLSDAFPGRIYKLTLEGKLLGNAGAVWQEAEAVRLDSRNGLSGAERAFVAELLNWRVQKLLLQG
jgi:hypothetical protein